MRNNSVPINARIQRNGTVAGYATTRSAVQNDRITLTVT